MSRKEAAEQLQRLVQGSVLVDEPMSCHTSFHIGGPADVLVVPATVEDVAAVLSFTEENDLPLTVLGNGSNVLVRDGGIRGVVLKLGNALKECRQEGNRLHFGSGVPLSKASRLAYEAGLTGMEFAVGIPGSIGGAVYMNAGAYDGEMKDVVTHVKVMTLDGEIRDLSAKEMDFSYRHSILQTSGDIVLELTVEMEQGDPEKIRAKMDDFSHRRSSKQPLEMPSAGSTFKRPAGHFVGPMIEESGLKGYRVGGAEVSVKHAGFVVNAGGATAHDVLQLIDEIRKIIRERYGVELQPEVMVLGEEK